ncbi:Phospholipase [Trichoderma simmonsii]|uniref:Phospholipase n=1 Tax=Trichoderma simmonsii TaxID=1491479 RepID=A0A8G0L0F1_9HYPO|nr:Phospholipase [Trichoderma simmonsii]
MGLFGKVEAFFGGGEEERHSHSHSGYQCDELHPEEHSANRFQSFAAPSSGNIKWFVDGCSYFWAVSEALQRAQESIYILDWWLSPELYLRRPPSRNEQYRLDAMLKAAAERGVKVHVIVYKEVEAALTLDSAHTKHALEKLHPNISVFRHPDHAPAGYDIASEIGNSFKNLTNFNLATMSKDTLKAIYGAADDVVLYWAHHEKLLVVDRNLVFMGGLDLCFGRWDTNSHPIADAHPGNVDNIIFPGQDYNNARIFDFADVGNWDQNQLDRTKSSRMGWSDVALSMNGPIVSDLVSHFVDRWNFMYDAKYNEKDPGKYVRLSMPGSYGSSQRGYEQGGSEEQEYEERRGGGGMLSRFTESLADEMGNLGLSEGHRSHHSHRSHRSEEYDDERSYDRRSSRGGARIQLTRSCTKWSSGHATEHSIANAYVSAITNARHFVYIENQFFITATSDEQRPVSNKIGAAIVDRIVRAYEEGQPFKVWVVMPAVPAFAGDLKSKDALGTRAIMEFQYNSISRGGHSIIQKLVAAGIENPREYIGFYNLRNYDRINTSSTLRQAESRSGVSYEDARRYHDDYVNEERYSRDDEERYDRDRYSRDDRYGRGDEDRYDRDRYSRGDQDRYDQDRYGRGDQDRYGRDRYDRGDEDRYGRRNEDSSNYDRYQRQAQSVPDDTQDTVSAAYMKNGPNISHIPWNGAPEDEFNAFVSEQLYIHTKLLIADDRLVICGSANLNDRSQLGTHDSEIAVVIEGPTTLDSYMNGERYEASEFAASLRRQIFRKHLGLLPDQRWDQPTQNWLPVTDAPNDYDWGSSADRLVEDPLSSDFLNLWEDVAHTNTKVFSRAFHPVPDDRVRTWDDYDEFFSKHFIIPTAKGDDKKPKDGAEGKVPYGHVVPEEFPGGVEELKDWLGRIRGNLVNMPLQFLIDVEDIAEEGLTLNGLTDELYT